MTNGYTARMVFQCAPTCPSSLEGFPATYLHLLLDFIVLPDHKNVTGEIACPMQLQQ